MSIETMKVKPWGEDQGEFVIINAEDFNEDVHEKYVEGDDVQDEFSGKTKAELSALLDEKEIEYPSNANKATLLELCRKQ